MATLTTGTLMDDAAIAAAFDPAINGAIFDYTVANAGETILVTSHLCRAELHRVFSPDVKHQEGTAENETLPTNFTPAGSNWQLVIRGGEGNSSRFVQVDVI